MRAVELTLRTWHTRWLMARIDYDPTTTTDVEGARERFSATV